MKKIIAIVVTYNRKKLLEEAIEALLEQYINIKFDILIVDNASTDGTYDEVVKKYENENLKYLNTGKNIGGAGGFNFGIRYALENEYEYAWLMDDDTIVLPNTLNSLVKKAELLDYKFSFLSSLCKWTDGSLAIMNKQVLSENWLDAYEKINDKLLLLERASFVSFYLNLEIAKKAGLPYKEFFIYGDDWEYCLRLGKYFPGYLDLESEVIHKMKENVSVNIYSMSSDRVNRCYYNYRNLSFTYRKTSKKRWIEYILKSFLMGIVKTPFKAKDHRLKRMWIILKGHVSGLFFHPKIEYVNKTK